jgi:Hsp70 protein
LRVKLFQIEEPDGQPADPEAPGAAIGIDASGGRVEVAFSVGGNAVVLEDREGFEQVLPVPAMATGRAAWQELLEGARMRAERALARPVTHAVILLPATPDADTARSLRQAAEYAGLAVLRVANQGELAAGSNAALAAAMLAEDLAPRPDPV